WYRVFILYISIHDVSSYILLIFFFLMIHRLPRSTLFPYTTLFRSISATFTTIGRTWATADSASSMLPAAISRCPTKTARAGSFIDRKSTRLNSSHLGISYAVFCLKKKKQRKYQGDSTPIHHNIKYY